MKKFLQKLLGSRFKQKISAVSKISGFTLLELLVAAAIAGIIVSSLLAFLVSILNTDRREQARTQTQEEIQAALDFIADDLKEAVYIYDADGVERLSTDDPPGIRDQLPGGLPPVGTGTPTQVPVLVFWKRIIYAPEDDVRRATADGRRVGSTTPGTDFSIANLPRGDGTGETRFVWTLVAYYLRSNRNGSLVQSNSMQIRRYEYRDGIRSDCQTIAEDGKANCGTIPSGAAGPIAFDQDGDGTPETNYWIGPDKNFRRFDKGGIGTLRDRMNRWKNLGTLPTDGVNEAQIILDFVDDTFYTANEDNGTPGDSSIFVPIRPNTAFTVLGGAGTNNFFRDNADCADPSIGVGRNPANGDVDGDNRLDIATQRIPSTFSTSTAVTRADNSSSFFACVNSVQNVARVWIRGNSLVRQFQNPALRRINPTGDSIKANSALTTASIRATGRSSIAIE